MGCILILFALISPRLALVILALTSDKLSQSMDGVLLPILGFFLLPWTTLAYAWFWAAGPGREVAGFEWAIVAVAFLIDVGALGGGARSRRD